MQCIHNLFTTCIISASDMTICEVEVAGPKLVKMVVTYQCIVNSIRLTINALPHII